MSYTIYSSIEGGPVDLEFSEDLQRLREEVRRFVAEKAPNVRRKAGVRSPEPEEIPLYRQWMADLFEAGYLGANWPAEWGGRPDRDPLEDFVVDEELARSAAPPTIGAFGLAAGAILEFGSREQQEHYLPRIRRSEDLWCQLFSEPGAGSDLASLSTRAHWQNGTWVVDGQKVWNTNAEVSELGYLLARTDPDVPKHDGISAFILDMKAPGVLIRPLREMTGTSDFSEVFLNGVRVPPENVIGKPGEGWKVATQSLVHERAGIASRGVRLQKALADLVDLAKRSRRNGRPAIEDPAVRQELARLRARTLICTWGNYSRLTHQLRGEFHVEDAPIGKIQFSELNLDMARFALELQGSEGVLVEGDPAAPDAGRWQDEFLYARAFTIAGGSNEIMRNMISERALKLPKDAKRP
jgi:alkylation response protein AidB-like acyl-CoA dehydrogenase